MPATRTRRPRKSTAKKPVAPKNPTAKVIVTETTTTVTPDTPVRPDTLLKFEDYQKDFKIIWEIHLYEWNALIQDCKWVYKQSRPYVLKAYEYCKDSYDRAFNQDTPQPVK